MPSRKSTAATSRDGCAVRAPKLVCFEVKTEGDLAKLKKLQRLWADWQRQREKKK